MIKHHTKEKYIKINCKELNNNLADHLMHQDYIMSISQIYNYNISSIFGIMIMVNIVK